MEAGRELDIHIAEKVMGWRHIREDPKGYWAGRSPDSNPLSLLHSEVPRYSTDMNAAWEVEVEIERRKVGREYIAALLDILDIADVPPGVTDGFTWEVTYVSLLYILRATPEQRCLAALKAIA